MLFYFIIHLGARFFVVRWVSNVELAYIPRYFTSIGYRAGTNYISLHFDLLERSLVFDSTFCAPRSRVPGLLCCSSELSLSLSMGTVKKEKCSNYCKQYINPHHHQFCRGPDGAPSESVDLITLPLGRSALSSFLLHVLHLVIWHQ